MNWKDYLFILSLTLITLIAYLLFQSAPGYMDAEYYYAMGLRIARDHTLSEPFIWNFLNGFRGLPQPGFGFWMPLPAFIAGLNMIASNGFGFSNARIGFVLIASVIPQLTTWAAYKISGIKRVGLVAGLFAVFTGFYSPFLTTTDSFAVMMFFGILYLLIAYEKTGMRKYFFLGLVAGLMHLARTDGFVWLVPAILIAAADKKTVLKCVATMLFGYVFIMLPWFIRNSIAFGTLLPAGNTRMFWMSSYNDLFLYHADELTFASWIGQGIRPILDAIFQALVSNLKTTLFVQGQIILFPLITIGLHQYRNDRIIRSISIAWLLVLLLMTIIFPFAGLRGGFFHSGAAFQPILWILAAGGIDRFIDWGIEKRQWNVDQARQILPAGQVVMLVGVTVFVHINRVQGGPSDDIQWNRSYLAAIEVDKNLDQMNISDDQLIMINNPPGFYIASGRASVAIPSGGLDEVVEAARDFGVDILIIESNHPESLDILYKNPGQYLNLTFSKAVDGVHYYQIQHKDKQ